MRTIFLVVLKIISIPHVVFIKFQGVYMFNAIQPETASSEVLAALNEAKSQFGAVINHADFDR